MSFNDFQVKSNRVYLYLCIFMRGTCYRSHKKYRLMRKYCSIIYLFHMQELHFNQLYFINGFLAYIH